MSELTPVSCPICRRTLAKIEDGEVVIRLRDRFRVVAKDGEVECLRCMIVVNVLTDQEIST